MTCEKLRESCDFFYQLVPKLTFEAHKRMKDTAAAFRWIVEILQSHNIPFQIAGGLAARSYGATRELADIDIDIPEERFAELLPELKEFIKFGPEQYKDANWDLLLMTLNYKEQDIDLGGAYDAKVFDQNTQKWTSIKDDFSAVTVKEIYGMEVPVISKEGLIGYKSKLARDVDKIDILQMAK